MSVDPSDMYGPCDLCEGATVFGAHPCASCGGGVCPEHRTVCECCGDASCTECFFSTEPRECLRCFREREAAARAGDY